MAASWRKKDGGPSPEELKNVPGGLDSSTFFSPCIPSEVRAAVPLLHDHVMPLDEQARRQLLGAVVAAALHGKVAPEALQALQQSTGLSAEVVAACFAGLLSTVQHIVRQRVKASVASSDLSAMHVPGPLVSDLLLAVKGSRPALEQARTQARVAFPTVDKIKWRVDVTISSSSLARVLKPTVIVTLLLSDGGMRTMEVPVKQLHQLRYQAAKVLQSMQELERHPILRLAQALEQERKPDAT